MSWPFSLPLGLARDVLRDVHGYVVSLYFPRPLPGCLIECFAPGLRIAVRLGEIVVLLTPENLDGLQDSTHVGAHSRHCAVAITGAEPVDDERMLGDDGRLFAQDGDGKIAHAIHLCLGA